MIDRRSRIISHRGNLSGPDPDLENKLEHIETVLNTTQLDVEIDIRAIDGKLFLGHDSIEDSVSLNFLLNNKDRLWIHCKNIEAYEVFSRYRSFGASTFNFFFHDKDPCALTSNGWLWGFPNSTLNDKIQDHYVHVLPEFTLDVEDTIRVYKYFCTDYPLNYEKWIH